MDKVKVFVAKLWKQRFWVLTGTVSLLGLIFVLYVTSSLHGDTTKRDGEIGSALSDLDRLSRIANHPNEEFHEAQKELNDSLAEAVGKAWAAKWKDQLEKLVWPEELGSDFLRRVERLRPIERHLPLVPEPGWEEPLSVPLRERYAGYISDELSGLAETVRSTWDVAVDSSSNTGGSSQHSSDDEEEDPGMVHWDPANQQEIQQQYFRWPQRRNALPTTLDVLYAQEDLWVLKALTQIIAETNKDSDARHNLIIKDINFIQIGRMAGMPASDILYIAPSKEGDESRGPGMEVPGGFGAQHAFGGEGVVLPGSEAMGMGPGMGEALGGVGQDSPAEGRYVDNNYLPLPAQQLWNAEESNEAETAYLAVAKRMPIRMGLTMDQREINRLLIECGNSPLTVEVRQVRIDPENSGRSTDAGNRGGPGRRGYGGESPSAGHNRGAGSDDDSDIGPYDVSIEIYGIIYIFNPLDKITRKKLSPDLSDSEEDSQAEPSPAQPPTGQNPVPAESE